MKLKIKPLLLLFLSTVSITNAQLFSDFSSLTIPSELRKNANAVLRLEQNGILMKSYKEMIINYKRVITVLNEKGDTNVNAFLHYDDGRRIKKLEVKVYDKFGIQIKRIKKKDFVDVSAVSGGTLYSDSRVYYLDYTPVSYPYTIEFVYEYETNNTAFLKGWSPLEGYHTSMQKSEYTFTWFSNNGIRFKEKNFEGYNVKNTSSEKTLHYTVENVNAIRREYRSPKFSKIAPSLMVAANKFHLEGVDGYASNWKEFGQWYLKNITFDTNDLSAATKSKIKVMVNGVEDPLERAKIVHQYMQNKTRYISVQIGIGGWKPMLASEVDKLGYGDCKALTNYTKSLLEAADVTSYFTILYGSRYTKKSIEEDFTAMQGNHAILAVENGEDLVWIDCTSQRDPFGFVAGFTDDRMALVVKPSGGEIIRTKKYEEKENYQKTTAVLKISEEGAITANVTINTRGNQYRRSSTLETDSKKDREEHYKESFWDYINNLFIETMIFSNDKEDIEFTEELSLKATNYGTRANGKLLVTPNAFNRITSIPDRYRNRKMQVEIERGYLDEDAFEIHLPEGYGVEFMPEDVVLDTKFGEYSFSLESIGNTIVYKRKMLLKEGKHPKEEYVNYRAFMKKVVKFDNVKIVFAKK
ncbi:MAG: DUF3857 domain-containing protein [Cellulophaga sp.]